MLYSLIASSNLEIVGPPEIQHVSNTLDISSKIAVLFKKGSAMDCNNYRGLSLISHIGKVLERLIQNRLVKYVEEVIHFIPENQNGFRSARSTIDSIFCSRIISSYCREKHNICIKCFVDLTKAYDKVDRDVLWLILKRIGVPDKLIEIIII